MRSLFLILNIFMWDQWLKYGGQMLFLLCFWMWLKSETWQGSVWYCERVMEHSLLKRNRGFLSWWETSILMVSLGLSCIHLLPNLQVEWLHQMGFILRSSGVILELGFWIFMLWMIQSFYLRYVPVWGVVSNWAGNFYFYINWLYEVYYDEIYWLLKC